MRGVRIGTFSSNFWSSLSGLHKAIDSASGAGACNLQGRWSGRKGGCEVEDSKDKLEPVGPIWTLQDRLVPRELLDGGGKPSPSLPP